MEAEIKLLIPTEQAFDAILIHVPAHEAPRPSYGKTTRSSIPSRALACGRLQRACAARGHLGHAGLLRARRMLTQGASWSPSKAEARSDEGAENLSSRASWCARRRRSSSRPSRVEARRRPARAAAAVGLGHARVPRWATPRSRATSPLSTCAPACPGASDDGGRRDRRGARAGRDDLADDARAEQQYECEVELLPARAAELAGPGRRRAQEIARGGGRRARQARQGQAEPLPRVSQGGSVKITTNVSLPFLRAPAPEIGPAARSPGW